MAISLLAALPELEALGQAASAFGLWVTAGDGTIRVHGRYPCASTWRSSASCCRLSGGTMSQRSVELLIGRLVTDDGFRRGFLRAPADVLAELRRAGYDLSPVERAAITSTDPDVWRRAAAGLDPRLHKIGGES